MNKRLRNHLSTIIPCNEMDGVYNSYDIIGDIAIIRSRKYGKIIAHKIMEIHKNVKTVLAQTSPVRGDYRLRKLDFVAGEDKTRTVHREFGCLFYVDVQECYFSPRLLHERMRIAKQVRSREIIVNMFAGVGCFSIVIAKHTQAKKIYSIDISPVAIHLMKKNVLLNKVHGKVISLQGDAREVIEKELYGTADRVLMPLPQKAIQYLPFSLLALKKEGGWIHDYLLEHAEKDEDPIQKARRRVSEQLRSLDMDMAFEFDFARVVRTTGPRWYQIVLDIHIIPRDRKFENV